MWVKKGDGKDMDDKVKLLGAGITIGVLLVVILIVVIGAKPTNVVVGPVSFEIPTQAPPAPTNNTSNNAPSGTSSCPSLSSAQIEQLKASSDVETAIRQAENFAGYHQNDYKKDSQIPNNVVIAMNLYGDPAEFPVIPIKNNFGSGLFLTTNSFTAPNDGTYWCVQP
jgi:hypothetical protein